MRQLRWVCYKIQFVLIAQLLCTCTTDKSLTTWKIDKNLFQINGDKYDMFIEQEHFRIFFSNKQDHVIIPAHTYSGLTFSGSKVVSTEKVETEFKEDSGYIFNVINASGENAEVQITFADGIARFHVMPQKKQKTKISLRLGGMSVAHGLGDAGAYEECFNLANNIQKEYIIENNGGQKRWVSTFVIFPQNDVAGVFFGDGKKSVIINENEYVMSISTEDTATFYFFLGTPTDIYKNYKEIRIREGYIDVKPKFRLFELGWESWDALGWNTNQKTVQGILEKFISNGYQIRWAVTGSGYWEQGGTTTSFGKWGENFPDPQSFKKWMHSNDIKWLIGLRTNFIPSGGPYFPITDKRDKNLKVNAFIGNDHSKEAQKKGFLVNSSDNEFFKITSTIFPIVPCYLLNGNAPEASEWFQKQYTKWGVDGIKEDTMMDIDSLTGIYNSPITEIANKEGLVLARNGEFTAPGTLLRINDTRGENLSQRIPNNYFQYAASGFSNVYSDVAGVHNMHNLNDIDRSILHTWLLSLTSGLAVGTYPDKWPIEKQKIFRKAIDFHYSLAPYLYSAAIDAYNTGYPYTLTPLSIAFPHDSITTKLEHFEWMIGESILATPLLKNHPSGRMNIYLPTGKWFDYETGRGYDGPVLLKDYEIGIDKTPCFIGGKGIIIQRKSETIIAKIYPVVNTTTVKFTYSDGVMESQIVMNNVNWPNVTISDLTDSTHVSYNKISPYWQFKMKAGHDYLIQ
jgi:alpha-glucosidase (family GH31 glycosyl hydrolase)